MLGAQASRLPDGRLHLHHGPIDLVIGAYGSAAETAYCRAAQRFDGLLQKLVDELPELRKPVQRAPVLHGIVAQEMLQAVMPFKAQYITPMAAVAGAVADTVLAAMLATGLDKAYINNGGDISVYLGKNQKFIGVVADVPQARLHLEHNQPWRGIATSGWRGRSLSLGIADSVSVIARTAASADAAATIIANHIDLPNNPAVQKQAAQDIQPDSDLGELPVTVSVGALSQIEISQALQKGALYVQSLCESGLIGGALLSLQGQTVCIGTAGLKLNEETKQTPMALTE